MAIVEPTGFTVAIPVYNEEAILVPHTERLLSYLQEFGSRSEVILGSNGSTDATPALGVELARRLPQVSFFHIERRGVGLAFREFIRRARYPFLISLDMDLSVDLSFVSTALAGLETHDIVIGSKKLATQNRLLYRRLGSDFFLYVARTALGLKYDDYSIGAKAYRLETLRQFEHEIDAGSSYVLDVCFLAQQRGFRIARVPVLCEDLRVSKFNLLSEAGYKFMRLLVLWWRRKSL